MQCDMGVTTEIAFMQASERAHLVLAAHNWPQSWPLH